MFAGRLRLPLLISVLCAQMTLLTGKSYAGPILDWLFGRQTTYYQPVVVNAPSLGGVACSTNPATYQQAYRPVVANYVPQTRYRTVWAQIPVTYYRPVISADPATGAQVTVMQPCTSYQWQLRRVPVTTLRAAFGSLFATPGNAPLFAQTAPVTNTVCTPTTMPMQPIPAPATPVVAPMTSPSTTPSYGSPTPASSMPADQTPELGRESRGFAPTSGVSDGSRQTHSPQSDNGPNANASSILRQPTQSKPGLNSSIQSESAPNVERQDSESHEPPPLIDPRDKTAGSPLRRAWKFEFAKYQKPATDNSSPIVVVPPDVPQKKWETGGWYVVE